jgi:hypothetical protein
MNMEKIEFEEDVDYGFSFDQIFCDAISAKTKQFLFEYCGESFLNLEPETYLEIAKAIEEKTKMFGSSIPDILYQYRTIRDSDKFDEALENFVPDHKPIKWYVTDNWFNRDFSFDDGEDDEEDAFFENSNSFDLTEREMKVKEVVDIVDGIIENTRTFAHFVKSGYNVLNPEIHLFIEENALFDLSILSDEGFVRLQNHIDTLLDLLLDDLYSMV